MPVLRAEDAHANLRQRRDLRGNDDPAPAAVHLDVPNAGFIESLAQVAEVLDVPALVGRDRHPLHVLLDGRGDHVLDAAVVAEVDHLGALGLQDAAHDVDGRIVTVEQRCGGDETDGVLGHVHT